MHQSRQVRIKKLVQKKIRLAAWNIRNLIGKEHEVGRYNEMEKS